HHLTEIGRHKAAIHDQVKAPRVEPGEFHAAALKRGRQEAVERLLRPSRIGQSYAAGYKREDPHLSTFCVIRVHLGTSVPHQKFAPYLRAQAAPRGVLVVAVSSASGLLLGLAMHPPGHESRHRLSGSAHYRPGDGDAVLTSRNRAASAAARARSSRSALIGAPCEPKRMAADGW